MFAKKIDIEHDATTLRDLIRIVEDGTEVMLMSGDKPIARLVPVTAPDNPRIFDLHPGAIEMHDDFDEELPDEFWLGTLEY